MAKSRLLTVSTSRNRSRHLADRLGVAQRVLLPGRVGLLASHQAAPMRQLVHRPHGQPPTPVKELPVSVSQLFPELWGVVHNPAVQLEILAAGHDLQRIKLQVLHGPHGLFGA